MSSYQMEDFEWFLPEVKTDWAITIPNIHCINFNQKLLPQLPECIEIGVGAGGRVLCVREHAEGYRLRKSGSIKTKGKSIIDRVVLLGVRLPARYSVTREGDYWIARLEDQEIPTLNVRKTPRRPRAKDVAGLCQEVKNR